MDSIRLNIENKFILDIQKYKRQFILNNFGQYNIVMIFKDIVTQIELIRIDCTEKDFFNMIQSLNYFCCQLGSILSDNIYFNSCSKSPYFLYVYTLDECLKDFPDDEEPRAGICIYQGNENNKGSICRLYFDITYYNLEELIYQLYTVVEDIPYLEDINKSFLEDIFDQYIDKESYERYMYNIMK